VASNTCQYYLWLSGIKYLSVLPVAKWQNTNFKVKDLKVLKNGQNSN
jgi:hypothetical protein